RDDLLQNNQNSNNEDNEDNPNKNIKKSSTNISIKSAIREYTNTEDHNNAEKLEISRIQIESLQKKFASSNVNIKHIIGVMRAIYFLAKKNLLLKLLPTIVELLKESDSLDLFNSTITYTNNISRHKFLEAISNTIKEEI
ncbi:31846_t:CDS:2, partial [Gigaspora margarita]